jgi:hypothetical protein
MREQKFAGAKGKVCAQVMFQLTVLVVIVLCGQGAQARTNSIAAADLSDDLKLTMRVVNQSYCYHGTDMFSIFLALRLRYTNMSASTVILRKNLDAKAEVLVSTDQQSAAKGIYEYHWTPALPSSFKDRGSYGDTPDERFVTLKPGQAYETDDNVEIPVTQQGLHPFRDSVSPGKHVLTIKYFTWLEGQSLADQLRKRWNTKGGLFSSVVASEPIWFEVAPNLETEIAE